MATIGIRRKLLKVAGIAVLVTGIMTTARGLAFAANSNAKTPAAACPLCESPTPVTPAK
jgi:hypothetical protein